MEAHYIGFNMWAEAVRQAGTTDVDAVKDTIIGVTVPNLSGGDAGSDYLPGSRDLIADWRKPMECGNFNVVNGSCGGSTAEEAEAALIGKPS